MAPALMRAAEVMEAVKGAANLERTLRSVQVKDLQALLIRAHPSIHAPKGNKQELLAKVIALQEVKDAIQAVAAGQDHVMTSAGAMAAAAPAAAATADTDRP